MKATRTVIFTQSLLIIGTLLTVTYSYVFLVLRPYLGFVFDGQTGEVLPSISSIEPLQAGDHLLQIGEIRWQDFVEDLQQPIITGYQAGDWVPVKVLRGDQEISLQYRLPVSRELDISVRYSQVWFPFIFLFFAYLVAATLRPRDTRWLLLLLFNLLTAIWLSSGLASGSREAYSAILFRMVIWISIPVTLHLHWVFPWSLGRLPKWVIGLGYGAGVLLAGLQGLQIIPPSAYALGFLVAIVGSLILVIIHLLDRHRRSNDITLLLFLAGLSLSPLISVGIMLWFGITSRYVPAALLSLGILPLAYYYTAVRRQLGWLEAPFNRAAGLVSFGFLLSLIGILGVAIRETFSIDSAFRPLAVVFMVVTIGTFSILSYPAYQRWFERRLLGIPWQAERLKDLYTEQITTRLDLPSLVDLLQNQILPSLQIRQSALLYQDSGERRRVVYASGLVGEALPEVIDDPVLLAEAGRFRPASQMEAGQPYPWVRLALPLRLGERLAGLWLFGKREPDDYYAAVEIETLQSLANQTSVALANITQSDRLHALYQADIALQEAERQRLARILHDDVLHQLAILNMNASAGGDLAKFESAYQAAVNHVRTIMNNLRPAMLAYGLRSAIEQLADELPEVLNSTVQITIQFPESEMRYPPEVELQLYRIAQEACRNALKHAQASQVIVSGALLQNRVDLVVTDDGIGMQTPNALDLAYLAANQHYGLSGMVERAALIGAQLFISPIQPSGTRVEVRWQEKEIPKNP